MRLIQSGTKHGAFPADPSALITNLPVNFAARQRNRYRVCGLHIGSTVPFPELQAEAESAWEGSPDVDFELGGDLSRWERGRVVMTWEDADGTRTLTCTKTDYGYRFHYPGYADFLVDSSGRRVSCVARAETEPETIRHLFLDQVIPPLLNLRGREALHASAVQTPGGACAFIGPSGAGKSTLAAAFHAIGYAVLSDDCLLLKENPGQLCVEPAYPGLRLWEDSRGALFDAARSTLPVCQYTRKLRISTPDSFAGAGGSFPLHAIYSLGRQENREALSAPQIEPLSVRDAFMELVEFAFRLDLTDQAMILRQMRVLERVATEVPVRRLRLPNSLALLPAARELILQDLKRG